MAANGATLEAISATPLEPAEQERYQRADRRGVRGPSADRLQGRSRPHRRPRAAWPASRRANSWRADLDPDPRASSRMTTDLDSPSGCLARRSPRASSAPPRSAPQTEQIGRVEEVGDGIALVSGLPTVRLDELLRFDKGQFGFAQVLERDRVGCVLLDDVDAIEAGDTVRGTGDVVRVPVGPALLGRVVDPLGRPLDGKGPIAAETLRTDRAPGTGDHRPRSRDPAGADRPRRRRYAVRARPRPARAHHRRPRHRQDHDRDRHDHQSEDERHRLRLCRGRPEELERPARHRRNPRQRRARALHHRRGRVGELARVCNGSRPSPASPWRSISAIAASTP